MLEPLWGGRLLLRDQLVFIWRNERSVFTAANTRHRVRALRPAGQRRVNEREEDMKHLHGEERAARDKSVEDVCPQRTDRPIGLSCPARGLGDCKANVCMLTC